MAAASEPPVHVMLTLLYLTANRTVDRDRDVSSIVRFETRPSGDANNDDFARSGTTGDKRESRARKTNTYIPRPLPCCIYRPNVSAFSVVRANDVRSHAF